MEFEGRASHTGRLRGIEKFEGERENFTFNTFIYYKPVKRFENRSRVSEFRSYLMVLFERKIKTSM